MKNIVYALIIVISGTTSTIQAMDTMSPCQGNHLSFLGIGASIMTPVTLIYTLHYYLSHRNRDNQTQLLESQFLSAIALALSIAFIGCDVTSPTAFTYAI